MPKINIVIPMAGLGSRFASVGYDTPKPFIDVNGKMMIERVMDNLAYDGANYILIAQKAHLEAESKRRTAIEGKYPVKFLSIDKLTIGASCTVLAAYNEINNDVPLMIANSDQIIEANIADFVDDALNRKVDGSILTFEDDHPKWSYAKINDAGFVTEVVEKKVISNNATVGIYFYAKGSDYIRSTIQMIVANDTMNGEFYVAPNYNYLIREGKKIGIYEIDKLQMNGIGTPEDLDIYLEKICKARS